MGLVEAGKRGELGKDGIYFSDLYADAVKRKLTARVRVTLDGTEANAFFREGKPSHVSGTMLTHDYLGEILVRQGVATHSAIDAARQAQDGGNSGTLGSILILSGSVSEAQIKGAIRTQIDRRMRDLFRMEKGRYEVSLEQFAEIKKIELEVGGESILLAALKHDASEAELNDLSDALLGNAVRIACPRSVLAPLGLDDADNTVLDALDRPRKTHHLELVAESRRTLRGLLKTLLLLGHLERRPAREGIPIKAAVKVQAPNVFVGAQSQPEPEPAPVETPVVETPVEVVAAPRAASRPPPDRAEVRELKVLHGKLGKVSHFELLGVKETSPPADVRTSFTNLAKRFHPDALGTELTPEVAAIAREVSAALNDAHATLTDPERRTRYLAQMREGNVAGDEQTAGRTASAKVKYEMALVFMKKHDLKKAQQTLKMAVDMAPQNGLYRGTLGWVIYADPQNDRTEALVEGIAHVETALEMTDDEAPLHFYYGRMLKERGDMDKARSAFQRTLELDPKHRDAAAEIRLLEMREAKDSGAKKGGLSRFFRRGKKDDEES
ncbi:MAG: DnaJ domain-containing protein [Myxococcota bacterium]